MNGKIDQLGEVENFSAEWTEFWSSIFHSDYITTEDRPQNFINRTTLISVGFKIRQLDEGWIRLEQSVSDGNSFAKVSLDFIRNLPSIGSFLQAISGICSNIAW